MDVVQLIVLTCVATVLSVAVHTIRWHFFTLPATIREAEIKREKRIARWNDEDVARRELKAARASRLPLAERIRELNRS